MNTNRFYPGGAARLVAACALAALFGSPSLAAKTVRATVDAKGSLRFSKATLKALGVRPSDGMVAVELPLPPRPLRKPTRLTTAATPAQSGLVHVHGPQCDHSAYEGPPRLFVTVRRDGSLEIRNQKLPGTRTVVPGAPGTTYLATADRGKLILARPK